MEASMGTNAEMMTSDVMGGIVITSLSLMGSSVALVSTTKRPSGMDTDPWNLNHGLPFTLYPLRANVISSFEAF